MTRPSSLRATAARASVDAASSASGASDGAVPSFVQEPPVSAACPQRPPCPGGGGAGRVGLEAVVGAGASRQQQAGAEAGAKR